jgi:hypothetical protein
MRYPNWFPRPKSWLWAILITLAVFPLYWIGKGLLTIGLISGAVSDRVWWAYAGALIGLAIVPIWIFSLAHQWLWDEPHPKLPKWIPRLKNLGEGGYAWFVLVICLTAIGMFVSIGSDRGAVYQLRKFGYFNPRGFILTCTPMIAYGYHLKYLIAKRFQPKQTS